MSILRSLTSNPEILTQAGLDAAYDVYAFGGKGDLNRGLAVASGSLPEGC